MHNYYGESGGTDREYVEKSYKPEEIDQLRSQYDLLLKDLISQFGAISLIISVNEHSSREDLDKMQRIDETIDEYQNQKDEMTMTGQELEKSVKDLQLCIDNVERLNRSFKDNTQSIENEQSID